MKKTRYFINDRALARRIEQHVNTVGTLKTVCEIMAEVRTFEEFKHAVGHLLHSLNNIHETIRNELNKAFPNEFEHPTNFAIEVDLEHVEETGGVVSVLRIPDSLDAEQVENIIDSFINSK